MRLDPLLAVLLLAQALFAQPPRPIVEARCGAAQIAEHGLDCPADEPCPVLLELTTLASAGARLVAAGNLHTGAATLESVILLSEDEGLSWREVPPRLPAATLDQLQLLGDHGWAAGVVLGALPKDPFVLRTSDGGLSWRRVALLDEGAIATIEVLTFDTPTHGAALVQRRGQSARYLTLETENGGETWSLQQSSVQPPAVPKPKPNPAWRLRPDRAAKAYSVERLSAGRWHPVSTIPLAAGSCRPEPPQVP